MSIYMQPQGINGDVSASSHQNWIELLSVQFGLTRSIHTGVGNVRNREGSIPNFNEITISKLADSSSPHLFDQTCSGKTLSQVTIDFCHTGDNPEAYAQIVLSDVIISQFHESTTGQSAAPLETYQLNYSKIERSFIPRDANNQPQSRITAGYDLGLGQKL